jgi:beta-N-acetylhexosaminidase
VTAQELAAACLLPGFDGLEAPDELLRWIDRGLGGVVLFGKNIHDREQLRRLTARLSAERPALLIATDEEGGDVTRLEAATGSSYPGHLALGVVDDVELTRSVARAMGAELAAVGSNLDFAPVADVNTNPDNPVIGVRSFGPEPELVARHVAAFVDGMQGAGVAACAKHFPGHGDTNVDSHLELPVAGGELEEHLTPFRAAVAAGVASVMTAHIVVPELGPEPATINPAAVRLLREELGFDGVIVSDALEMRGVAALVGAAEAGVRALQAGVDALCLGHDLPLEPVHDAIVAALDAGRLSEEELEQAALRVSRLGRGVAENGAPGSSIGAEAARRALRFEGDVRVTATPLIVELVPSPNIAAGERGRWLGEVVRHRWPDSDVLRLGPQDAAPEPNGRPIVVVMQGAARHAWQRSVAEKLTASRPGAVVVETGLPGWTPPGAAGVICTHGAGRASLEAAADVLSGRERAHSAR